MFLSRVYMLAVAAAWVLVLEDAHAWQNPKEPHFDLPAADEPFADQFSLERARTYLTISSRQWFQERACVTCHTNGLGLVALKGMPEVHREAQAETKDYLKRIIESDGGDERASIEAVVGTTAFLMLSLESADAPDELLQSALEEVWRRQSPEGHWAEWLKCNWPPFEVDDHYGVTLMWLAMAKAHPDYLSSETSQEGIRRMRGYLTDNKPNTHHQKAMLVWANAWKPGLLTDRQRQSYIDELIALQNADGGWNLISLGPSASDAEKKQIWVRTDGAAQDRTTSDGYATGFVLWVLVQAELDWESPAIQRGLNWLKQNQRRSGRWFTRSPRREGRNYISNAATAFATMVLSKEASRGSE